MISITSASGSCPRYKQVSAGIGADKPQAQRAVAMMLAEMAFDGDILETEPGKYRALQRNNVATGTFVRRSGVGYC